MSPAAHPRISHAEPLPASGFRVVICVATFRRPAMLRALLDSFVRLEFRGLDVHVVVVDNDAAASARPVIESLRVRLPFPVSYLVEPERNIALARNRGVREALARDADFVAFIDDDEVADPDWLIRLVEGQRRFGADVVVGAVLPILPEAAPEWLGRGGFFQSPRHPTGTRLRYAHTSNVLVSSELLRAADGPFDPDFGISGGSDSIFFTTRQRAGARMVFVDEAVVEERIPPSRAGGAWILQRAFRMGNVAVRMERILPRSSRRLVDRVARGTLRMMYGVPAALPLTLVRGRAGLVSALWNVAYGAGCLAALAGYRYMEYRRVHGE